MKKLFRCFTYLLVITSSNNLVAQHPFDQLEKKTKEFRRPIKIGMSTDEVKRTIGNPDAINPGFPDASYLGENYAVETSFPESSGQLNYSTWQYYKKTITVPFTYTEKDKYFINGTDVSKGLYEAYLESSPDAVYYKATSYGDTSIISVSEAESRLEVIRYLINDYNVEKDIYDDYFNYSRDTVYIKQGDVVPVAEGRVNVRIREQEKSFGRADRRNIPSIIPTEAQAIDTMYTAYDRYGTQIYKVAITSMRIDKGKAVKTKLTYKPVVCVVFDRGTSVVADSYVIYLLQL